MTTKWAINLGGERVPLNDKLKSGVTSGGDGSSQTPTDGLFFAIPASGYNSEKLALAHYFGPFPISVENADPSGDYWLQNWLSATPGESGAHTSYGGYSRDRPVGRLPRPGTAEQWKMEDSREDVRQAYAVRLDGFFCNIMGLTGTNVERYTRVRAAANELHPDGKSKIIPMIDTNGSVGSASASSISDHIATYAYESPVRGNTTGNVALPSGLWRGGKFVVGSYKADGKTASWWQEIFDDLSSQYGIEVAFVAVLSNYNNASSLDSVTSWRGLWGSGADPNIAPGLATLATSARSSGKGWMSPIWAQDMRPQGKLFDEARNTECLRAYWTQAIADNADMVQLCTWSDYREGGEFNKSAKRGMSMLELSAYYIHKWKTGSFPTILRDAIYLTHRNQPIDLGNNAYTSGQTEFMTHWARASRSNLRNEVEILTFLTEPASITVNIGSNTYEYNAPAGMYQALYPISLGGVDVVAMRSSTIIASVASVAEITNTPYNQDRGYYTFSSISGTTGQFDISAALQEYNS